MQFPQVQNFLAQKGASYLSDTLDTRVEIGRFTTDWRNALVLEDVYVEDQQQDTLWYSERLGVDIGIFALLSSEVNVSNAHLQNATLKLHIRPDSSTNYDFITEAFATDTAAAQPADTTGGFTFNVGTIQIDNVYVNFKDELGGNWITTRIGQFVTTMEALDLDAQRYMVDEVELRNTGVNYVQTKLPPDTEEESEPLEVDFGINRVMLENIDLSYFSQVSDQSIELALGKSELVSDNINLNEAKIDLRSFDLHNTALVYSQNNNKSPDSLSVNPERTVKELDESVENTQGQPVDWVVNLGEIDVTGLQVKFDNFNEGRQKRGMDYNHMLFRNIVFKAEDILYSQNRMGLNLNQLKLTEQSGFRVENFQAAISLDSTSASLANLDLKTGNSRLQNQLAVSYPSLDAVAENPELVALNIDIENSYIGMRDVQYFAPFLLDNPSFRNVANSTLRLSGEVRGPMDNLSIESFRLAGLTGTDVAVSGNVRNAMDPDNLYMNLDINRFSTTRTDIKALSPPGTIPPDIQLPAQMSLTGNYRGSLTAFDANADLRTSFGNVAAVVDMGANESFTATVRSGGFDLGQMLPDSLGVGEIALEARARGTGLTPETMRANIEAQVQRLDYNNYTYNGINLNATINQNLYQVQASADDENLNFTLDGDFNLRNSEQPSYAFTADIESLDLQALNLYPDELSVRGQLTGDFTGADASSISGRLDANNLLIQHKQTDYPVDSLQLTIDQQGDGADINLNSNIAAAEMHFGNSLETLPTAMQKYFSSYFDLQPDPPYPAEISLDDFSFVVNIKRTNLITSFVPGLERLQPSEPITGEFNSQTQQFRVDGHLNLVEYTDFILEDLDLTVRGNEQELGYTMALRELNSPSLNIQNVTVSGAARDDEMSVRLAITDSAAAQDQFVIGGVLNSIGRGYRFSFNPDQLVINSQDWSVPQDNFLQFGADLLYANNIVLSRGNSSLSLNSVGEMTANAPLQVGFNNFEIGYIMESFQQQDSMIVGTINGEATVRNLMQGTLAFTSDLNVSELAYMGIPVGNIALEASSSTENRYNIEAALTGNRNQMTITGFYEAQPNASLLNFNANINSLNLAALEGFTQGMVKDMDGTANGNMRITGTLDDPNITGQLNFNQAQFNISMLNSLYRLQDERLVFDEQGIRFPNFTITDSLGNDLEVNGIVSTQDYTDYQFDLTATTDRFLAMNSTAQDSDLFYGTVWMNAEAAITGDMAQPVVQVEITVLDGSNFTTVIPADGTGAAEREGIVEFVNLSPDMTQIISKPGEQDSVEVTGFVGADIEAQINVTDATPITIVIDPTTGDNLVVRGTADPLYIGMRPSGEINMNGRYTITEGRYSMDFYDLASRELDIAEGSYISWSGDPLQATMDITAIYSVRTAPQELVASQIAGTQNPALQNQVEFQVLVNVTDDLLTPNIGFDIQLAEEEQGEVPEQVLTSLGNLRQDESELNKQVFALLVLNRFLAPDPLASSGGGLEASARNSLSGVLSDQLNNLTSRYAGGLGLELGVDSYQDHSSGSAQGRTDLNVALRQQFLNDRLTVRVGTDIGLEGGNRSNQSMSGFGGDISVEYSLTEDGRLRVRGFQRNQYEGVLEGGDVRSTGVSLIYVREYNDFADLFRSIEEVQRREEQRKQEESRKYRQKQQAIKEENELKEESTQQ
ncbi:translocation/assembly module TamB domain-containing protein [Pontibacter harenae]|uniref:translocation/assembly module TamB domain-containing protein n=1 Tax=Pontibacter harenae TaxID=2894083 RepID=UPI001E5C8882|nr:translocation/assembly module TamB [Pontibacter harenae]MCC9167954.1 translocation/assembly module TamB domain-containing protein [Pontibacter harenae]